MVAIPASRMVTMPLPKALSPRRSILKVTQLEDRTAPALYSVTLLSPPEGDPGQTAATHAGRLRLNPDAATVGPAAVVDAATPADAVRVGLFGAVAAAVGGRARE